MNGLNTLSTYLKEEKSAITQQLLEQASAGSHISSMAAERYHDFLQLLVNQTASSIASDTFVTQKDFLNDELYDRSYVCDSFWTELIDILCSCRLGLMDLIRSKGITLNIDLHKLFKAVDHAVHVFDIAIREVSTQYNQAHFKSIHKFEEQVLELTAPLVPLSKKVAILPLIGTFEDQRAAIINAKVAQKASEMGLELLIIDFSGIESFDSYVAQHIFKIRDVLQLIGVTSILTGIRPSIAQTAVQLGISIDQVDIFNTVEHALEAIRLNEA
ncbi:STAS domain-containing protein [Bacillus testis]|uniref:STAS domain-containing protein n=1 Tax=Bacillus testis TaxID=1622072 RepID=UPI00067F5BBD|nr:STAS domain-containing protein [Bacillus testis]